jgi:hypothetical protein
MLYTTVRLGPKRWGLFHEDRLLATVMTQRAALQILERLYKSPRPQDAKAIASGIVPLKRSNRGRRKSVVATMAQGL